MDEYAFTVKYLGRHIFGEPDFVYKRVRRDWQWLGCKVTASSYEYDSRGRFHMHGIVMIPKKMYRKLMEVMGVHMRLDRIDDEINRERWIKYINKDQDVLEEVPKAEVLNPPKYSLFK